MKADKFSISIATAALCGFAGAVSAETMGTAFTYQGRLERAGVPVTDACDFELSPWNGPACTFPAEQIGGHPIVWRRERGGRTVHPCR